MPGKVIGISLNNGYPGTIARNGDEVSKTRPVKVGTSNIAYGDPVVLNSDGTIQKFEAAGTDVTFAGVAIRKVKSALTYTVQNAYYQPQEAADILERGSVTVQCNVGSPAIGGAVYVRVATNVAIPAGVVGGFEAAADDANTILITDVQWGSTKDSNSVAELVILTRKNV